MILVHLSLYWTKTNNQNHSILDDSSHPLLDDVNYHPLLDDVNYHPILDDSSHPPLDGVNCHPILTTMTYFTHIPNLPQVWGKRMYKTDHQKICDNQDVCRKYSSSHPTVTPGTCALFCRLGICCGFQVMESYKSPRHPFKIFLCRFPTPPKMIVYDIGCKLHQYVLNREPVHFKNTIFLVDRFHWGGHVGCSIGYSLDGYTSLPVASINSTSQRTSKCWAAKDQRKYCIHEASNFMFHVKLLLGLQNRVISKAS